MTYPQPREGITGVDRADDDLLALDDKAVARRLLMIGMAGALQNTTLVGSPAPTVARIRARMDAPQPGDLVMETATPYRRNDPDSQIKGFGILVAHRDEWQETDEEWQAMLAAEEVYPGDRHPDDAWYVQYGPAAEDVCRWTNADFVAIPTGPGFTEERPMGTDGIITRNDVAEGLADAGFTVRRLPDGGGDGRR